MNASPRPVHTVFAMLNTARASAEFVAEMRRFFRTERVRLIEAEFADGLKPAVALPDQVDLAVSFGGDGTLLSCTRLLAGSNVPILPVNLGTVGFITEISADEWQQAYHAYVNGTLGISTRIMLETRITRAGGPGGNRTEPGVDALNDTVIAAHGRSRIIRLRVYLFGTAVANYRADGMIVATPTGSTAYSMAAGGPILHPEMDAFAVTPICPFTLSNRPLVVPADCPVEVEIESGQRTEISLTVDGVEVAQLRTGDRIAFSRSVNRTHIIRSGERNFYQVLRAKLDWAGEPRA